MSKHTSIRVDNDHKDALERMVEAGEADSASEAFRQTSQAELARRGYLTDERASVLTSVLNTVGFVCAVIGVVWLATTFVYPVEFRMPALVFLLAGLGAFTLEWALDDRGLGAVLGRAFGRGEKA